MILGNESLFAELFERDQVVEMMAIVVPIETRSGEDLLSDEFCDGFVDGVLLLHLVVEESEGRVDNEGTLAGEQNVVCARPPVEEELLPNSSDLLVNASAAALEEQLSYTAWIRRCARRLRCRTSDLPRGRRELERDPLREGAVDLRRDSNLHLVLQISFVAGRF